MRKEFRNLLLVGAVALLSTSAMADDKVFGAGACYQTSGAGVLAKDTHGSVYNSSTSSAVDIDCPIVRDNPAATISASQISFDVFDRSSGADVSCWFINELATSSGLFAVESDGASSSSSGNGVQNIVVTTSSSSLGATQFSHVRCWVPAWTGTNPSHVVRIWVNEP